MVALAKYFDKQTTVEPGKYRHYKGGLYIVLYVAKHSETNEQFVVYQPENASGVWARPLEMFLELVHVDGRRRPRFERLA